jgi:hypothetical protein
MLILSGYAAQPHSQTPDFLALSIQFLLGHASIQTTERYLESRQNLKEAVNDRLGLDT